MNLAQHVKAGIDANDLYIIPYPEARSGLEKHFGEITASIPPVESDPEGVKTRLAALQEWAQSEGSRQMFTQKGPDAPV